MHVNKEIINVAEMKTLWQITNVGSCLEPMVTVQHEVHGAGQVDSIMGNEQFEPLT